MKFGSFQVLHIIVNHLFKMTEKQQKKNNSLMLVISITVAKLLANKT